ncbi:hypothetical protein RCF19_29755 [Rhodococcus qingshengii]
MRSNTKSPPAFPIDVYSGDYSTVRPLGPYIRAKFQWKRNVATAASFQIKITHPLAKRMMEAKVSVIPIRTYYNGIVWDGRVMDTTIEGQPGREIITVTCVSNMKWLQSILGFPNPMLPVEVQFPKQDIAIGPVDFVCKYFVARNANRLNKPVYVKVPSGGQPVKLPAIPPGVTGLDAFYAFVASLDLCAMYSRMTPLDELFETSLKNSDSELMCNLWVQGDDDAGALFSRESLDEVQQVFDLEGDNFLLFTDENKVLDVVDPNLHTRAAPAASGTGACYIVDTRKKRDRRWMQWTTDSGQIVSYKRNITHPTAHQIITGGQSPTWVNELVRIVVDGIIGLILSVFGAGFLAPSVGGMLDDIFLAFNRFTNPALAAQLGPHAFGEAYANAQVAFTLDSLVAGLQALKDHAGKDSIKIQVQDGGSAGKGFEFGVDDGSGRRYDVGDIHSFVDGDTVITDYISEVIITDERGAFCQAEVTIGDDEPVKDPFMRMVDKFKEFGSLGRVIATSMR